MKTIHTLIPDIYALLGGKDGITNLPPDLATSIDGSLQGSLGPRVHRGLRLSQMGSRCPRQLWYSLHQPELEERLPPEAKIKFCYGHIIEHLVIGLAKAAGHTVEGEQDEVRLDGVLGHRDCIIDGAIVDVKSASTPSFRKFRDKTIAQDDSFGYLDQLDGYVVASLDDPRVTVKDRGYLLAVDKQLGHLCLYEHMVRPDAIRKRIQDYKSIAGLSHPPACTCETESDGEAGNIKLSTKASYSSFKHACFPGLRTFLYSKGPQYYTKVVKYPKYKGIPLTEVDRHGNIVYGN